MTRDLQVDGLRKNLASAVMTPSFVALGSLDE